MKRKSFTCSGEKVQVVRQIETGSFVFLFNLDSNTIVGPFTATGSTGSGLEPGGWKEVTDERSKASIRLEWEDLHELGDANVKFSFLKDIETCRLSHFQTQDLLEALKGAPLLKIK